jgi:phage-related protein
MAVEQFKWPAQHGAGAITYKDTVRTAQYGDGYEQVAEQGINSTVIEMPLIHTAQNAEVDEVLAFLRAHTVKAFSIEPPGEVLGLYRVIADSITKDQLSQHVATVSWTIRRAYGVFS